MVILCPSVCACVRERFISTKYYIMSLRFIRSEDILDMWIYIYTPYSIKSYFYIVNGVQMLGCIHQANSFALYLDSKLGEKRKERDGRKGKEGEGRRGKRRPCLFRMEGEGKERKFYFPSKSFLLWRDFDVKKLRELIPPNPSPSLFAIQTRGFSSLKILPIFFPSFPSIQTRPYWSLLCL